VVGITRQSPPAGCLAISPTSEYGISSTVIEFKASFQKTQTDLKIPFKSEIHAVGRRFVKMTIPPDIIGSSGNRFLFLFVFFFFFNIMSSFGKKNVQSICEG